MGQTHPWRETKEKSFEKTEKYLIDRIKKHFGTTIRLCLVGHTGAGKSSYINSVFTVSRGRLCDMSSEKNNLAKGCGTNMFRCIKSGENDMFKDIEIYDTMGINEQKEDQNKGIKMDDIKIICEGHIQPGHKFNRDAVEMDEGKYEPHCVVFVISAEVLEEIEQGNKEHFKETYEQLCLTVPEEIARVTVITKCDKVCRKTASDTEYIYTSQIVYDAVKTAAKLFGVAENRIFPVVNYVKPVETDHKYNVPILYSVLAAMDFGLDKIEVSKANTINDK